MLSVWTSMKLNFADDSVVIVPSVTVSRAGVTGSAITQAFEERFLFLLLLLRQPNLPMGLRDLDADQSHGSSSTTLPCCPVSSPGHALARLTLVRYRRLIGTGRSPRSFLLDPSGIGTQP